MRFGVLESLDWYSNGWFKSLACIFLFRIIDKYTTISFRDIYIYYNIFFENIFVDLHQRPNKCRHFIHFTFHFKYIKASLINGTFESYIQKHQKLKFSNLKNIHVRGKLKSFAFMTVMDGAERWRVKRKYISMAYPLWIITVAWNLYPMQLKILRFINYRLQIKFQQFKTIIN